MSRTRSWPSQRGLVGSSREHMPRRVKPLEAILALVVVSAIVIMAIWFVFISSGGIGPGSV